MNKSGGLQLTLNKPSSKDLVRIKEKLRENEVKSRQFESMCYQIDEGKYSSSIIPNHEKERKISKKQIKQHNSPGKLIRSKSKKLDQSLKKHSEEKGQKNNIDELYTELMAVKSEYKTLKHSYNKLIVEKNELTEREQTQKEGINLELQKCNKEVQRYQKMVNNYEQQIERIKREFYKLIENEKLKNKKLQETLQEKDLMIAYLRSQLEKNKRGVETTVSSVNQSSIIFLQNNPLAYRFEYSKASINSSMMQNVIVEEDGESKKEKRAETKYEQDSLSFSRDKSKQMDSIHSFLTNHDLTSNNITKKDIVIVQTRSSYPENDGQCLTFEHRGEDQNQTEEAFKNQFKTQKNPFKHKEAQSLLNLPPKNINKKKLGEFHKKVQIDTDENSCVDSNKNESIDTKKCTNSIHSSRQRKKHTSKKKFF